MKWVNVEISLEGKEKKGGREGKVTWTLTSRCIATNTIEQSLKDRKSVV